MTFRDMTFREGMPTAIAASMPGTLREGGDRRGDAVIDAGSHRAPAPPR